MTSQRLKGYLVGGALLGSALGVTLSGRHLSPSTAAPAITIAILAFALIAGKAITDTWRGVFIDDRNRISLSRLQMFAWFLLILPVLLAGLMHNVGLAGEDPPLDVIIPGSVLALMGISLTSMAASPLARSLKRTGVADRSESKKTIEAMNTRAGLEVRRITRGTELANVSPNDALWSDVVSGEETGNGALVDLGKLQNLYITVALLLAYGTLLYGTLGTLGEQVRFAGLPPLSEGLVALLGVSHAGYLTYKVAPHSNPTTTPKNGPQSSSQLRRAEGDAEHAGTEPTP
jgi:hypothetical protein